MFEDFSKLTGKGDPWTIILCVGEKNRAAHSNFSEKMALQSMSFETTVSSLDFVYRKLRQTPENPEGGTFREMTYSANRAVNLLGDFKPT